MRRRNQKTRRLDERKPHMGRFNREVVGQISDLSDSYIKALFKAHGPGAPDPERIKRAWEMWVSNSDYHFANWKAAFEKFFKMYRKDPGRFILETKRKSKKRKRSVAERYPLFMSPRLYKRSWGYPPKAEF